MEKPLLVLYVFCIYLLSSGTVPLSPCGGSFCVEKENKGTQTIYLVPCDGELHAYPKWVCGYFTNNIFSCFFFPLQDATVLQ